MTSKSSLRQVGDEAALLVGDGEQQVDAGDVHLNAGRLILRGKRLGGKETDTKHAKSRRNP